MANFDRLSIRPGEYTVMEIGFSEVACHLRVAGQVMTARLSDDGRMVQLYQGRREVLGADHVRRGWHLQGCRRLLPPLIWQSQSSRASRSTWRAQGPKRKRERVTMNRGEV